MATLTLGLIINPLAGIGGAVGLKGSDGAETVAKALASGAQPKAEQRTRVALEKFQNLTDKVQFLTWGGDMGENLLADMGFAHKVLGHASAEQSCAEDTLKAAQAIAAQGVDLLLFAGGDGTARNICDVLPEGQPVLGIPAGVKIHSGVYGVTPGAAGEIVRGLITGQLTDIRSRDVRDLDEQAFREGRVKARHYGELLVPEAGQFLQNVKQGGREVEELVLQDIADDLNETLEDHMLLIAGPGSTTKGVFECLGLESTLLGVDVFCNGQCLAADASEQAVWKHLEHHLASGAGPVRILITAIGGQGHILGRGNQQISAAIVEAVLQKEGMDGLQVVATKTKLKALEGRPLLVDSGSPELDRRLSGTIKVITGYHDAVLYPLTSH
ncbi:ATP-NAD kinase family protein [Parendozoicomonas haliclonae]|uniref:ATP-NAD kinase n=1 Tax=Parendozoicomonas haliclonae TaxID=1960125 RepID=A0A1X7AHQ6_9GAMM|nr:ATP-NAD kinase family protein [Parendozoicomonas haliclonae]SMA43482.1 ATP-NAD kinase [Parendozoicomonas haliclonae]